MAPQKWSYSLTPPTTPNTHDRQKKRPDLRIGTGFHDERFIAGIFQGCDLSQSSIQVKRQKRFFVILNKNWQKKPPGIQL